MKIHEVTEADGSLSPVELVVEDGLALRRGGETLPLPDGALEAVMKRYGADLDPEARTHEIATLTVDGKVLRHVRHLAIYDVIARDWLVYDGQAVLAPTVAGALEHLATAGAVGGHPK